MDTRNSHDNINYDAENLMCVLDTRFHSPPLTHFSKSNHVEIGPYHHASYRIYSDNLLTLPTGILSTIFRESTTESFLLTLLLTPTHKLPERAENILHDNLVGTMSTLLVQLNGKPHIKLCLDCEVHRDRDVVVPTHLISMCHGCHQETLLTIPFNFLSRIGLINKQNISKFECCLRRRPAYCRRTPGPNECLVKDIKKTRHSESRLAFAIASIRPKLPMDLAHMIAKFSVNACKM